MALALPHSVFFHIGRTAGYFVREAVHAMGIPNVEVGEFHDPPSRAPLADETQKVFFCFVRHPLRWLRSYWALRTNWGWDEATRGYGLDQARFADFLEAVIERFPTGLASNTFAPFIAGCHEVGRSECVREDLLRILKLAGERFHPDILGTMPPMAVHVDPRIRAAAVAPRHLLEAVLKTERAVCDRWGYEEIPDDMVGVESARKVPFVTVGEARVSRDVGYSGKRPYYDAVIDGTIVQGEAPGLAAPIRDALATFDFQGKAVVDVGARDGVFLLYAASRGARRVVGMTRVPGAADLARSLGVNAEFIQCGLYGCEERMGEVFDVAFCFDVLPRASHPQLLIRSLSRLLRPGGTLFLACNIYARDTDTPMIFTPLGREAPFDDAERTFFSRAGLLNALAAQGFDDMHVSSLQIHPVTPAMARRRGGPVRWALSSDFGWIVMSCRFDPTAAASDSRFGGSLHTAGMLRALWDGELPRNGCPSVAATSELTEHLLGAISDRDSRVRALEHELVAARHACRDREADLTAVRSEMDGLRRTVEVITADLVHVRQVLIERTLRLEQALESLERSKSEGIGRDGEKH